MISKVIKNFGLYRQQVFNFGLRKKKHRGQKLPQKTTDSVDIQDSIGFRYDITPQKQVIMNYDLEQNYQQETEKKPYLVQADYKLKQKMIQKEFKIYEQLEKDKLTLTPEELEEKYKKQVKVEIDDLWLDRQVSKRVFEKKTQKELFWRPRDAIFKDYSLRKINYLKDFQQTGKINHVINEIFNQIKEKCKDLIENQSPMIQVEDEMVKQEPELFQQLKDQINNVHFSEFIEIGKKLNEIRYKKDNLKIWEVIENNLHLGLHSFNHKQLIQLQYVLDFQKPRIGSQLFHKKIRDLIEEDFNQLDIYDLMHLYQANRMLTTDQYHTKIMNKIFEKKQEILDSQDFDLIPNLIYTFANCRLKSENRKSMRVQNEFKQEALTFIEHFQEQMLKNFEKASFESQIRFMLAIMLLKVRDYHEFLALFEKQILSNQLDLYQIHQIFYILAKYNDGKAEGSLNIYNHLQKKAESHWDEFTNQQKSQIFYAYLNRNCLDQQFYENKIFPWIKNELENLCYASLSNVVYGLMAMNVEDKDIWRSVVYNVCGQDLIVPMQYLQNFKYSLLYIQGLFPNWNLYDYELSLLSSGKFFSIARLRNNFNERENLQAISFYKDDLKFDVKTWIEHKDTLVIDIAILPEKVAILVVKKRDANQEGLASKTIMIKKKLLEFEGYEVILHDCVALDELPFEQKMEKQNAIFQKAYQKMSQINQENLKNQVVDEFNILLDRADQMNTYVDKKLIEMQKKSSKPRKSKLDNLDTVIKFKK